MRGVVGRALLPKVPRMTPEDLSAYLLDKGLDPDAVQDVLVEYLTWTGEPIRYPKAWAWRRVYYRTMDHYRKEGMRGHRVDLPANLVSTAPNPLTQAEQRQQLERFAQTMKTSCRASHNWSLLRQRGV